MYQIYHDNKIVSFSISPHAGCDALLMLGQNEIFSPAKMLEKLGNNKHLCIKTQFPKKALRDFFSQFTFVEAAGGVVSNSKEQTLMILRRGKWDLPKGHIEPGENRLQAALREVKEETGLESISIGEPIADTFHFYYNNGVWEMKKTHWYSMKSEDEEFFPQTEEDITEVSWLDSAGIKKSTENTYSSIVEVLRRAGKLYEPVLSF